MSSSTLANVCCLLLLLSGNVEINPGPGIADVVKCVCSVGTDDGNMLQWETCSCRSNCTCIKISISLAQTYPFVCPLCVKDSVLLTSTLVPQVRKLEGSLQRLIHLLQNNSGRCIVRPYAGLSEMQESVSYFSYSLLPSKSPSKSPPLLSSGQCPYLPNPFFSSITSSRYLICQ